MAKADSEIEQILLSEISREFEGKLKTRKEQVFYQDEIIELIEIAKHNPDKMLILISEILKCNELTDLLINHFKELEG